MNKFKFYLIPFLIISLLIFLVSCKPEEENPNDNENDDMTDKMTIYTLNDFHGALVSSGSNIPGIARIGKYLKDKKTSQPEGTMILSAGDMFQGTALSNLEKGRYVVDVMNEIGFDAMTIGNHEFDWGLDVVSHYTDGSVANGEADFPFLGSNIIDKNTGSRVSYLKDYTIIDRGGLKIGIIGSIGPELEKDIATPMIQNYDLVEPLDRIEELATDLRTNQGVDLIIANLHEADSFLNSSLASLSGNARIDAIVNGHDHGTDATLISGSNSRKVPVVQAGSSGSHIGRIVLTIDQTTKGVSSASVDLVPVSASMPEDPAIKAYIDEKITETEPIFGRVIGTAGEVITKNIVCDWAPDLLKNVYGGDIGIINSGGIRANAFNISSGTAITVSKMFEIMPFDNAIKYATLTGAQVKAVLRDTKYGLVYSNNVNQYTSTVNGQPIDDAATYVVVTIDYVFDKADLPFAGGTNITVPGVLYRDVMISEIERVTGLGQNWMPSRYE